MMIYKKKGSISASCLEGEGENVWSGHQQWQHGQTSSLDHMGQHYQLFKIQIGMVWSDHRLGKYMEWIDDLLNSCGITDIFRLWQTHHND